MTDPVALVTGAGSGIGRAVARRLVDDGWRVAVVGRREGPLAQTVALIDADAARRRRERTRDRARADSVDGDDVPDRDEPTRSIAVAADVADTAAVDAAVARAELELGPLDAVVHAAGIGAAGRPVGELDDDDWQLTLDVDLGGTFRVCRAAVRAMAPRGRGVVITIASAAGQAPMRGSADYGAAKAGVIALTRVLDLEYRAAGLRCCCISPGTIDTPMTAGVLADPDRRTDLTRRHPLGRIGTAEDVAAAVAFVISPAGAGLAGAVVPVDGGYLARSRAQP